MSDVTPDPMQPVPPINDAGDGQVIPERQAKQGRRGLDIFVVLAVSTVLAAVILFAIWGGLAGKMNAAAHASGAAKAAAAQSFNAGPSQPRAAPNTPSP